MPPLRLTTLVADQFRLLTFRRPSAALAEHPTAYLVFGLLTAWAAGIGRYWDHPNATFLQYAGLGSVVYVPLLAFLLWAICRPLAPLGLPFRRVVGFVALTSLPAVLYAVPVERFLSASAARSANAIFLAVVAAWRVALLVVFMKRSAGLSNDCLIVGTLLPLALVVCALAGLNLEHAVFQFMARPGDRLPPTPNDLSYLVVLMLAFAAQVLCIPLVATHLWFIRPSAVRRRRAAATTGERADEPPSPR